MDVEMKVFLSFTFAAVVLVPAYLRLGLAVANLSWKAWYGREQSLLSFLLFPFSYDLDRFGPYTGRSALAPIAFFRHMAYYEIAMMFLWPIKMAWNLVAIVMVTTGRSVAELTNSAKSFLSRLNRFLRSHVRIKFFSYVATTTDEQGVEKTSSVEWVWPPSSSGANRRGSVGGTMPVAVPLDDSEEKTEE